MTRWDELTVEELHMRLGARLMVLEAGISNREYNTEDLRESAGLLLAEAQSIHEMIRRGEGAQ